MKSYSIPFAFGIIGRSASVFSGKLFADVSKVSPKELEQYLHDLSNLFLYKFTSLDRKEELSEEESKRLVSLLKEIIEVKQMIRNQEKGIL